MKKDKLKILIVYHKPSFLLKNDIYLPIHAGRDIAMQNSKDGKVSKKDYKWLTKNLVGDNTGENISSKNREWCELTAIYWAWKNYHKIGNPNYIGFMHYRRFFNFENSKNIDDIKNFVKKHDILIMKRSIHNKYYKNNYNQYKIYPNHHIEDLEKALDIAKYLYPEYEETINKYLNLDYAYFCNMFIMRKKLFFEYCEWLFSILKQLENEIDLTNYNIEEKRVFGYIAERLTGIFYVHVTEKYKLKSGEVPIMNYNDIINIKLISRIKNTIRKLKPIYIS